MAHRLGAEFLMECFHENELCITVRENIDLRIVDFGAEHLGWGGALRLRESNKVYLTMPMKKRKCHFKRQ